MILLATGVLLSLGYALLLGHYFRLWKGVPSSGSAPVGPALTAFTIVIPARNEASRIAALLQDLLDQQYPANLFEIIVVDDHSKDDTAAVVRSFPSVRLLTLEGAEGIAQKKVAIAAAVSAARHPWIACTDADCRIGPHWLRALDECIRREDPVFIAAPVRMEPGASLLGRFQTSDFLMLQAITAAVVTSDRLSMCNGANIAYAREAFHAVGGFSGIDHIASGDDMLLLHKIRKHFPARVRYLASGPAIVSTRSEDTWSDFIRQRIRWASKARQYQDRRFLPVLLLVFLFNLWFPLTLVYGIITGFSFILIGCLGALLVMKTMVEWPLFVSSARFFGQRQLLQWFPLFQPLHILYTVLAATFGAVGSYEWKGRRVN
jgi:cellulose synthase/poly-beta-1,6-N-acetylglucosamine synthase-like glycosyltransferase